MDTSLIKAELSGLELSAKFFNSVKPLFLQELPLVVDKWAVGLVGEGSECLGFDDAISKDHDWGAGFCIWLTQEDLDKHGAALENVIAKLPSSFEGTFVRMSPQLRMDRVGPQAIEGFYRKFINLTHPPQTIGEWRAVPEHYLSVCTNGRIFEDNLGLFSSFRKNLLDFYPEDIRLKKIAARCMGMAQSGQYNFARSLKRGENLSAMLAAARFAEQAFSMIFLLNRCYMPFYKWAHRGLAALPILGAFAHENLQYLTKLDCNDAKTHALVIDKIEELCTAVALELRKQGLSDVGDNWLLAHAPVVQSRIQTPALRSMPIMLE